MGNVDQSVDRSIVGPEVLYAILSNCRHGRAPVNETVRGKLGERRVHERNTCVLYSARFDTCVLCAVRFLLFLVNVSRRQNLDPRRPDRPSSLSLSPLFGLPSLHLIFLALPQGLDPSVAPTRLSPENARDSFHSASRRLINRLAMRSPCDPNTRFVYHTEERWVFVENYAG